jgi:hypothetical protein
MKEGRKQGRKGFKRGIRQGSVNWEKRENGARWEVNIIEVHYLFTYIK